MLVQDISRRERFSMPSDMEHERTALPVSVEDGQLQQRRRLCDGGLQGVQQQQANELGSGAPFLVGGSLLHVQSPRQTRQGFMSVLAS